MLVAVLVTIFAVGMAGTAEPAETNEWLKQARQVIARTELIDWSTASDDERMGLEGKEIDGIMMYSAAFKETWKTCEELLADKEDRYYLYTYEESKEYLEAEVAHMEALADNGAHFWTPGKGWEVDPQEVLQTTREECRQRLEEIQNGREIMYTVLEEGQAEDEWQAVQKTYVEVRETDDPKVVIQVAPGTFFFFDWGPTKSELRASLLESCKDCVYYGSLTQEQANDILSADFLN